MPRNLVLIIFCLALWQCRQEPVEKHDTVLTTGQQAIIRDYNSTEKYLNKPADSLEVFANSLFKRAGKQPPVYRALSQIVLGITYARQSKYQLGYKHFENALALAKSVKNDSLKARALSGIGAYYTNVGDYPKALETLLVALGIYEQIDDVKGLVTVNGLIGIVYMQKNDPALAKEHLLRALEQGKNIRHKLSYLTAAHTLANVYGISGDYAKALEVDEKALEICDSAGQTGIKNSFLDNKANCFLYMGKLDSAAYYFNECLQIDMASGNPKFMADTY
ncbi:MAG: tetratricopeptide repeat protein, partial [Sphingobacteriales bacterium]